MKTLYKLIARVVAVKANQLQPDDKYYGFQVEAIDKEGNHVILYLDKTAAIKLRNEITSCIDKFPRQYGFRG